MKSWKLLGTTGELWIIKILQFIFSSSLGFSPLEKKSSKACLVRLAHPLLLMTITANLRTEIELENHYKYYVETVQESKEYSVRKIAEDHPSWDLYIYKLISVWKIVNILVPCQYFQNCYYTIVIKYSSSPYLMITHHLRRTFNRNSTSYP